jgi:hypothetical protein
VGGEVLGLVDDHELVRDGAAADVGERLDLDDRPEVHQLLVGPGAALPVLRRAEEQELEVVEDRLHPGVELLVLVAGQVADVLPMGMIGRDTSSRWYTSSSEVFLQPAAIASSVLPVPALPERA